MRFLVAFTVLLSTSLAVTIKRAATAGNCKSCTLADINALNGGGNGAFVIGNVLVDGNTNCGVVGWSCDGKDQVPVFDVLGADKTKSIGQVNLGKPGLVNNDNLKPFRCSSAGKWQLNGIDVGKYTCNKKPIPDCKSCTLADINALNGGGNGAFVIGNVLIDGNTNCGVVGWSCDGKAQAPVFDVLGADKTKSIGQVNLGKPGLVNNDNLKPFRCSSAGKWQLNGADVGKYTCNKKATADCKSCTLADVNALNGGGNGAFVIGNVIIDGNTNCGVVGWSCDGKDQAPVFDVFGADKTKSIGQVNLGKPGLINNDNLKQFRCSAQGKWQLSGTDIGKYTCNKKEAETEVHFPSVHSGPCSDNETKAGCKQEKIDTNPAQIEFMCSCEKEN